MVALGNPVRGHIYGEGEAHPVGAYVVTSTFAEHVASGRGPGIDIGNGTCGFEIISMGRGRVAEAFVDPGNGAMIVRYDLLDYPGYRAGLAHMPSIETSVGVTFPMGVTLGHCGMSGAVACHLHGGLARLINGVWVEIDWWPLLIQNGATDGAADMIPIPGANYKAIHNKKTSLLYNGNFRNERKSGTVLAQFSAGTLFFPSAYANDGDVPTGSQSGEWFGGILYVAPMGNQFGWFHSSLIGPLVDDIAVGGYTQEQMNQAVTNATAPLNTRISIMHSKALDIADD